MSKTNTAKNTRPTHRVFVVMKRPDRKAFWSEIGAGWQHASGKGLSIKLTSAPLNGELVLLEANSDEAPAPDATAPLAA